MSFLTNGVSRELLVGFFSILTEHPPGGFVGELANLFINHRTMPLSLVAGHPGRPRATSLSVLSFQLRRRS